MPGTTAPAWNPMLAAAAAAAFASGRFPPPSLPPRLQEDAEVPEEKDGDTSSRSGSPMPLSGAGSSVEGVDVLPDASQTGHHWTFQEQFKQVSIQRYQMGCFWRGVISKSNVGMLYY